MVDTLGAGDTFNAGMIVARACGVPVADAVSFACRCSMLWLVRSMMWLGRLAGTKCGITGFDGVVDALRQQGLDTTRFH